MSLAKDRELDVEKKLNQASAVIKLLLFVWILRFDVFTYNVLKCIKF